MSKSQKTTTRIILSQLQIEIVRKDIKNIHLGVYPPDGNVRVSIPLATNNDALRTFLASKLSWIKKQKERFAKQERQTKREYVSGESHHVFGRRLQLYVHKTDSKPRIELVKKSQIDLYVQDNTTTEQKQRLFERFYRAELEKIIPKLIQKWEKQAGVKVNQVKIKKMKTKWGTCNRKARRIWLNLELAKQPLRCIDYVFVHELVHFKEKNHTKRFIELLSEVYPKWQSHKDELNHGILSYFERSRQSGVD